MLIKSEDLLAFLHKVVQNKFEGITDVILPFASAERDDGQTHFGRMPQNGAVVLDAHRTIDPLKILFYLARERMAPAGLPPKKRLILGVKACDLKALQLMDRALINRDFVDPAYRYWRENVLIVTTDCASIGETCHCNLVEGKPFAESGFDLNLSPLDGRYLIQVGSDKGEALLQFMKKETTLVAADDAAVQKATGQRERVMQLLASQNAPYSRANAWERYRTAPPGVWEEESRACIGCGACTNICPTCYCLILNDESEAQKLIKVRSYDSCQWHGYARVAGGGTPRPKMSQRFRNRYLCKFDSMRHDLNEVGCTGCGRCTEACAGEIDFRRVVYNVEQAVAAA